MTIAVEQDNGVDLTSVDSYQHWIRETIRFADLDTLGHVNNIAFATYIESGRVRFLSDDGIPLGTREYVWMAVKLAIEFKGQMNWPGFVDVGTGVIRMGRSSIVIGAGLFVDGICTATAECVMVYVDPVTSKSKEIPDSLRQKFLDKAI